MTPSARLLDRLAATRLRIAQAEPSAGAGERRSRAVGSGLEFAGHRPYRDGDDIRHLDPRVMARLGDSWVRQYAVDRRLPVFVLLDASDSMLCEAMERYDMASTLAGLFGFVALAAGDEAQIGFIGDTLQWSPRLHGHGRADVLFDWLRRRQPGGHTPLGSALRMALDAMPPASLVIVVSDWLDEAIEGPLKAFAAAGHELIAIRIAAPHDIAPLPTSGDVTLTDSETGESMTITLDVETARLYRLAFDDWQRDLGRILAGFHGRCFLVTTDSDPEHFFFHTLRGAGVLI